MVRLALIRGGLPVLLGDAWADAREAAAGITCPSLVIDSETGANPLGRAKELAERMGGRHLMLDTLNAPGLLELLRPSVASGARP